MATQKERLEYIVDANTKGFEISMKAIGVLAVAAFAATLKVTAKFEKQLSKLRGVTGANAKEMAQLERKAKDLGRTTAFTAIEVADLQFELAKLGFTTNDILNSSGGVLDLAAGLGVGLGEAATLAGSTIRAFGLDTSETGRVVDVLAHSVASSALDFSKLTESLKYAAPIARLYNYTIEETVGLLGALANAGIHGSQAGSGLRQIFLELDKKGVSFADALRQVQESANPASTALGLVGKRAAGALAIIANNQDVVKNLTEGLENSNGAANKLRETFEDNLIGDFDKLLSAITAVALEIGDDLIPAFRWLTQTMTKIINSGVLLAVWGQMKAAVYSVAIAVFEIGRAIDTVAFTISKGPFGIGSGSSAILLRINAATEALEKFRKKLAKAKLESMGIFIDPLAGDTDPDKNKNKNTVSGRGTTESVNAGLTPQEIESFLTGGPNPVETAIFNRDAAKIREKEYEEYLELVKAVEDANSQLSDSFNDLGNNIANSLTQSMGVFGAFLGTVIQGLLKLAAKAITSAVTTEITERAKQGAYGATAQAAAVAAAAQSASAGGPGAIALLPVFIAGALAAVAAAMSGTGANISASPGGGGGSSSPSSASVTPSSIQGNGTGGQLVATVRGQDLRFVLQGANDNYTALN